MSALPHRAEHVGSGGNPHTEVDDRAKLRRVVQVAVRV